jgi:hypothetical protein
MTKNDKIKMLQNLYEVTRKLIPELNIEKNPFMIGGVINKVNIGDENKPYYMLVVTKRSQSPIKIVFHKEVNEIKSDWDKRLYASNDTNGKEDAIKYNESSKELMDPDIIEANVPLDEQSPMLIKYFEYKKIILKDIVTKDWKCIVHEAEMDFDKDYFFKIEGAYLELQEYLHSAIEHGENPTEVKVYPYN